MTVILSTGSASATVWPLPEPVAAGGALRDLVAWSTAAPARGTPRLVAWAAAVVLHGLVAGAVLWALAPVAGPPAPPLVRLVFVEPPPPPPAGPGPLEAQGPAPVEPVEPPKAVPAPRPPTPVRRAPARLPRPAPAPPRAAAPAQVAPSGPSNLDEGAGNGVPGGTPGGQPGGVVGGRGTGPLPAGQVAQPPQVVSRVAPDYPEAARRRGIEGLVLLEAVLDAEGRVAHDVAVLRSVPDLDAAAVAALRRWRFRPARDETGRAVPVILEVPIRFVLR